MAVRRNRLKTRTIGAHRATRRRIAKISVVKSNRNSKTQTQTSIEPSRVCEQQKSVFAAPAVSNPSHLPSIRPLLRRIIPCVGGGAKPVSCKGCEALGAEYRVAPPSDLRKAIAGAGDSIEAGTIQELPRQTNATGGNASFQDIANGVTWGEFFCLDFQCSCCGQRFRPSAETCHGSGGSLRSVPAESAPAL